MKARQASELGNLQMLVAGQQQSNERLEAILRQLEVLTRAVEQLVAQGLPDR